MANLCIKTPSSAIQVLIFQLLVLRPRPNGQTSDVKGPFLDIKASLARCFDVCVCEKAPLMTHLWEGNCDLFFDLWKSNEIILNLDRIAAGLFHPIAEAPLPPFVKSFENQIMFLDNLTYNHLTILQSRHIFKWVSFYRVEVFCCLQKLSTYLDLSRLEIAFIAPDMT